jgi:RHS repeat-associated protein
MNRSGIGSFYLFDGLGSVTGLANSSGLVTDEYSYEAFGTMLSSSGAAENAFLFTGEQWDAETNLEYLRARYYSSEIGRFTQMDRHPGDFRSPMSLNKYLYGNASPVLFVDPSGNFSLISISVSIVVVGILATTAVSNHGTLAKHASPFSPAMLMWQYEQWYDVWWQTIPEEYRTWGPISNIVGTLMGMELDDIDMCMDYSKALADYLNKKVVNDISRAKEMNVALAEWDGEGLEPNPSAHYKTYIFYHASSSEKEKIIGNFDPWIRLF